MYNFCNMVVFIPQDIRNTESILLFKSRIKSGTVKNALSDYVDLILQNILMTVMIGLFTL